MADTLINFDAIGALARAVLAQLSPLTGTRATGTVTVTNATGAAVTLQKNAYLLPVVGGELADDLVFKVAPAPGMGPYGQGGDWTVPAGAAASVAVQSNLGGARHNLPAATVLRFDPPIAGLEETATLEADLVDGADADMLQRANYYELMEAGSLARDLHSGRLSQTPAAALIWTGSSPAEGRASGTNQGSTRVADGVRFFREAFELFIITSTLASDGKRRATGLTVLQAASRLLSDQQVNRDFERLASVGALEITGRSRFSRDEKSYVYTLQFRVNRILSRFDERTFTPWLRTHLRQDAPGREAPEPTTPLTMVDVTDPMPQA